MVPLHAWLWVWDPVLLSAIVWAPPLRGYTLIAQLGGRHGLEGWAVGVAALAELRLELKAADVDGYRLWWFQVGPLGAGVVRIKQSEGAGAPGLAAGMAW